MHIFNAVSFVEEATLGGLADSFYEYLLKLWLYTNKSNDMLLATYLKAMEAARAKLIAKSHEGLTYAGEYLNGILAPKMGHLACFTGGMFALTSIYVDLLSEQERLDYQKLAVDITNTCHESYVRAHTHLGTYLSLTNHKKSKYLNFFYFLGPENFYFNTPGMEARSSNEKSYILRPEVIESYFYLWRMTKDNKYRAWAWDAAQALDKYCRTENGYSGITNVYEKQPGLDDVQQSFFLAETLKYLYLIFSDDDVISLDEYVLNTEAHPFRIKN